MNIGIVTLTGMVDEHERGRVHRLERRRHGSERRVALLHALTLILSLLNVSQLDSNGERGVENANRDQTCDESVW